MLFFPEQVQKAKDNMTIVNNSSGRFVFRLVEMRDGKLML